jgi:TPR repeat protein
MIVPEKGSATEIEVLRGWVVKNKAWAQNQLGDRYYDGHGVEKSINKAEKLYESAANQGDTLAMSSLCHILFKQQKYTQWQTQLSNQKKVNKNTLTHHKNLTKRLPSWLS